MWLWQEFHRGNNSSLSNPFPPDAVRFDRCHCNNTIAVNRFIWEPRQLSHRVSACLKLRSSESHRCSADSKPAQFQTSSGINVSTKPVLRGMGLPWPSNFDCCILNNVHQPRAPGYYVNVNIHLFYSPLVFCSDLDVVTVSPLSDAQVIVQVVCVLTYSSCCVILDHRGLHLVHASLSLVRLWPCQQFISCPFLGPPDTSRWIPETPHKTCCLGEAETQSFGRQVVKVTQTLILNLFSASNPSTSINVNSLLPFLDRCHCNKINSADLIIYLLLWPRGVAIYLP